MTPLLIGPTPKFDQEEIPCILAFALANPADVLDHNPLTRYVVVRRDLPHGLQAAQIVHAAGESASQRLPPGTFAIVLSVEGPSELEAQARLGARNVRHTLIRENDPPYSGQATAIGVEPAHRSVLRRHFSALPLLGKGP